MAKPDLLVAAHQPNYLPWIGFFYKLWKCDLFVLLDTVQYTKNSFQNRNRLKAATGAIWLTVPVVTAGRLGQRTDEVQPVPGHPWQVNHFDTIRHLYRRAPYFDMYITELERIYQKTWTRLIDINVSLIRFISDALEISTPVRLASELGVSGNGTDLLIDVCQKVGSNRYLSGFGGRSYQDPEAMARAGISLSVYDFKHPTYAQLWGEFVPQLSAIDLLFNCGPEARDVLRASGGGRDV